MRAPPESLRPMTGAPTLIARSMTLQIFWAYAPLKLPPKTVKSWAKTKILRPSTRPCPVTTPSPGIFWSSMPKSAQRCTTRRPISMKLPGSRSRSTRSRAVSLPPSCCFLMRSAPPPRSARALRSSRRRNGEVGAIDGAGAAGAEGVESVGGVGGGVGIGAFLYREFGRVRTLGSGRLTRYRGSSRLAPIRARHAPNAALFRNDLALPAAGRSARRQVPGRAPPGRGRHGGRRACDAHPPPGSRRAEVHERCGSLAAGRGRAVRQRGRRRLPDRQRSRREGVRRGPPAERRAVPGHGAARRVRPRPAARARRTEIAGRPRCPLHDPGPPGPADGARRRDRAPRHEAVELLRDRQGRRARLREARRLRHQQGARRRRRARRPPDAHEQRARHAALHVARAVFFLMIRRPPDGPLLRGRHPLRDALGANAIDRKSTRLNSS